MQDDYASDDFYMAQKIHLRTRGICRDAPICRLNILRFDVKLLDLKRVARYAMINCVREHAALWDANLKFYRCAQTNKLKWHDING